MHQMTNYEVLNAHELGKLINRGELKASEVIDYFIQRIERINPIINAFTYTDFTYAKAKAKEIDEKVAKGLDCGVFAGVPFALKDFLPNKKGTPSTFGGVPILKAIDDTDSEFLKAMEAMGGIFIGKTNAPSFGFRATTDNYQFGPTKNPFNLKLNAGGSSGGSAAAVASGLVMISEGGDAGGSIRVPAAWCNCFGLKPSVGLIPHINRPDAWSTTHPYCFNFGLTKSVLDAAYILQQMAYYDSQDPISAPLAKRDYVKELAIDKQLKIAYTYDFDLFEVESEVKEQFTQTILKLQTMGYQTEEVHFNFHTSGIDLAKKWCLSISIDTYFDLLNYKRQGIDLFGEYSVQLPKEFIKWNKEVAKLKATDLRDFNYMRTDILDNLENVLKDYDLIISPVTAIKPVKNSKMQGETKGPNKLNGKAVEPLIGFTETFLVNFSGHPAASIPFGLFSDNIPFGLHVIAKKYQDLKILNFAYTIEKEFDWHKYYKIVKTVNY